VKKRRWGHFRDLKVHAMTFRFFASYAIELHVVKLNKKNLKEEEEVK
jgi:hypothetical protein